RNQLNDCRRRSRFGGRTFGDDFSACAKPFPFFGGLNCCLDSGAKKASKENRRRNQKSKAFSMCFGTRVAWYVRNSSRIARQYPKRICDFDKKFAQSLRVLRLFSANTAAMPTTKTVISSAAHTPSGVVWIVIPRIR